MAFKDILDPACRAHWWRLWSSQLAILAGVVMAWAVDNQAQILAWASEIPQPWRSILSFVVFAVVPITLRVIRQPKLEAPVRHVGNQEMGE